MMTSANPLSASAHTVRWGVHLLCLLGGLVCNTVHAQAATAQAPSRSIQWQAGLGYHHYSEAAMRLQGPEVGLGLRWSPAPSWRVEGQWWGSTLRYDSDNTGSLNGVANHEFRALALYRFGGEGAWLSGYQVGLAAHHIYNDLRGQTSSNARGYERISEQWWLPVRWQSPDSLVLWQTSYRLQYEAAWLLHGQQISRLSQASASYADARNTQRQGLSLEVSAAPTADTAAWEPYARFTRIAPSDTIRLSTGQAVNEPSHNRWQIGVNRVW